VTHLIVKIHQLSLSQIAVDPALEGANVLKTVKKCPEVCSVVTMLRNGLRNTGLKAFELINRIVLRVARQYLELLLSALSEINGIFALPSIGVQVEKVRSSLALKLLLGNALKLTQGSVTNQNFHDIVKFAGQVASCDAADTAAVNSNLTFDLKVVDYER
jgi:hypothetical protein